jgi:ligand-binding SRPBCC domain-containing protein
MKHFVYRTRLMYPGEWAAAFYRRTDAFRKLNPPGIFLQLHRNEGVAEGSTVDFTMWLGPLPVRWIAVHSDVNWSNGFTDTQTRGPFASWVHRHSFCRVGPESTEITDEITAEYGKGFFAGIVSRLMWLGLPALFAYRKWATRRQVKRMARLKGRPGEVTE